MKIRVLDLKAFGPFTDRTLNFSGATPGLHIIYGPNEAGKSSSLRALKCLLYGFPARTRDDFKHPYSQLLLGGTIERSDGQSFTFLRRKRQKADLLDEDETPIGTEQLGEFLGTIDQSLFESLYGIDHKTLVEGGEDILAQRGEVGQALFAAGTGISSLKAIVAAMEEEANLLFKERGSTQEINKAIADYNTLKKAIKEVSILPARWKEHRDNLEEASREYEELEKEKAMKSGEIRRLSRLLRAVPELAELENLEKQRAAFGDLHLLPEGFSAEMLEINQEIREKELQLSINRDRLTALRERQDTVQADQAILQHREALEDLHQRIGRYRKDREDSHRLEGMRVAYRREAGELLKTINPRLHLSDSDALHAIHGKRGLIREKIKLYHALTQKAHDAREALEHATEEMGAVSLQLAGNREVKDCPGLETALQLAIRAGEIDEHLAAARRELAAGREYFLAELQRMGLWSGTPQEALALPLPRKETVRRFAAEIDDIEKKQEQLRHQLDDIAKSLEHSHERYREIASKGQIPTEVDLAISRNTRQEGWQLLKRQWLEGEDIAEEARRYSHEMAVHTVYEQHVAKADSIADRLRHEADHVARSLTIQAEMERLQRKQRDVLEQQQKLVNHRQQLEQAWRDTWSPSAITPLSPREMDGWLNDFDALRRSISQIQALQRATEEKAAVRQGLAQTVKDELRLLGDDTPFTAEELSPILLHAEGVLATINHERARRDGLLNREEHVRNTLAKATKEVEHSAAALLAWHGTWNELLLSLGLDQNLSTSEAENILDGTKDCLEKLKEASGLKSRLTGIERDVQHYCEDVRLVTGSLDPELQEMTPDQAVLKLNAILAQALSAQEVRKKEQAEFNDLTLEIKRLEKELSARNERKAALFAMAGCTSEEELAKVIVQSKTYQRLTEHISNAQTSLAKVSEGVDRETIREQSGAVDMDTLPARIASLQREIDEEISPAMKDASEKVGEERRELRHMDGSGKAAEYAEQSAQVAAKIEHLVDRYVKIRLALKVLKDEIERYREEHQGPILALASHYFAELTLGSFAGLKTDVDNNDKPVLVGIRPDSTRVPVEGMSDGTCDQLFLALRLATLKTRLETAEPMPFIVDDILINFDDSRSRATLELLAEISKENQVLLFTHHRRVVEEAMHLQGSSDIVVHEL